MRDIIKNEWYYLIRNRVLQIVSIGFIFILSLAVYLGEIQSDNQRKQYDVSKKQLRDSWESLDSISPHGAAHYGTYVFKPTNLLSSLDEGINSVAGNVLRVEGHVQNEIVYSESSQMQAVSKFGKLKSSLLLQYVLPLFLLFLAFNSVSSEKQSGRLKLLVLQGERPVKLIMGKVISVWLYGIILMIATVVVHFILNFSTFSTEMAGRLLFFCLSYGMYYFIVSGLTVYFSARWKNATVALTSMLGIWILWTIFLPSIVLSTVDNWHKLPSRNTFQTAMKEDRSKGIDGHNPKDERGEKLKEETLKKYGVDSLIQLPINFDGIRMQADEEYGNKVWDKHFGGLRSVLEKQKKCYQIAGTISPFIALQNTSMGFSGTDNFHHQEFLIQVEDYRRRFIKSLNDEHAFGGSKTGDWSWYAQNDFFKSIPDYEYYSQSLSTVLPNYFLDFIVLIAWTTIVGLLLFFGIKNMRIV
ncbi:MAG: DUF3526 domain-containing protein [Crocinitomicaceae bacterium]|nr:DUF3526 domain-containing protein [Crocinitomicaceae bacterium]